jgi:NTP pyrophosphatase (non-canonical NTP hydrolase)
MDWDEKVSSSESRKIDRMCLKGCGCLRNEKGELVKRLKEIWDEVVEVFEAKDWEEVKDEVSDVMFGLGRLGGYVCGRVYVSVWYDGRHVRKIEKRFEEYGCVRSKRNLVGGKCPSLSEE